MKQKILRRLVMLSLVVYLLPAVHSFAWTDQAHMAVGRAADFRRFQTCAAADISHTVATINGLKQTDSQAHFYDAPFDYALSRADVYAQLEDIGKSGEECPDGYLLGAILHTVRLSRAKTESGAFDDYYYSVLLHYVADLSMPLHMSPYDDFNRSHHFACDDVLSDTEEWYPVDAAIALADRLTVDDTVRFETEEEVADAIISLAIHSQTLSNTIRAENRSITPEEALCQLSRSATLGRALLRYCGKIE